MEAVVATMSSTTATAMERQASAREGRSSTKKKSKHAKKDDATMMMQGQEILWVEEQDDDAKKGRGGASFRSFRSAKKQAANSIKVKKAHAIVLVEDDEATRFQKRAEATKKAESARRLLDAALNGGNYYSKDAEFQAKSKETLLKDAFQAAADAHRLVEKEADEQQLVHSTSQGEHEAREAWKAAAASDRGILLPPSQRPKKVGKTPVQKKNTKNASLANDLTIAAKDALQRFQEHAEAARRNLERMLPSFLVDNVSTDAKESAVDGEQSRRDGVKEVARETKSRNHVDDTDTTSTMSANTLRDAEIVRVVVGQQNLPAFAKDDMNEPYSPKMGLSTTISTLGFDNTFEERTLVSPTTAGESLIPSRQGDDISVSSLNEFLDGDAEDADEQARKRKKLQKAKSVPAVIASKPMHESRKKKQNQEVMNKKQNKPGFMSFLKRNINNNKKKNTSNGSLGTPTKASTRPSKGKYNQVVATMVKPNDDDNIDDDDISLKAVEQANQMDSALKEAPSMASWDGFAMHDMKDSSAPRDVAGPSFITAPDIPNGALTAKSWGHLVSGQPLEEIDVTVTKDVVSDKVVPKSINSKQNWFRLRRGGRVTNKEEVVVASSVTVEQAAVSTPPAEPASRSAISIDDPEPTSPVSSIKESASNASWIAPNHDPSITSDDSLMQPEGGDKYTVFGDETDDVADQARKRLNNKAPIVSDVDLLLTNQPKTPTEFRNVFSMDVADVGVEDSVACFGKVEICDDGADGQIQPTLLNRESVAKAMNAPRSAAVPVATIPMKRPTTQGHDGGGLTSHSFIQELEIKKIDATAKKVEETVPEAPAEPKPKAKPKRFWGSPKAWKK